MVGPPIGHPPPLLCAAVAPGALALVRVYRGEDEEACAAPSSACSGGTGRRVPRYGMPCSRNIAPPSPPSSLPLSPRRCVWVGWTCGNAFSVKMTGLATPGIIGIESGLALWFLREVCWTMRGETTVAAHVPCPLSLPPQPVPFLDCIKASGEDCHPSAPALLASPLPSSNSGARDGPLDLHLLLLVPLRAAPQAVRSAGCRGTGQPTCVHPPLPSSYPPIINRSGDGDEFATPAFRETLEGASTYRADAVRFGGDEGFLWTTWWLNKRCVGGEDERG